MILLYTDKAQSQLKSRQEPMLLQSTGHIWLEEETKGLNRLHEEFNDYLDSFRDIVSHAAQIYGFYHEIGRMTDNMGTLVRQMKASPANIVASAIYPRRNALYKEILLESIDIVNDIRVVCVSDTKMTQKERAATIFGIRPKLRELNRKLRLLALAVKYTSMSDVWTEFGLGAEPDKADKGAAARAALKRWKQAGRKTK
jgi:hypothetical protein